MAASFSGGALWLQSTRAVKTETKRTQGGVGYSPRCSGWELSVSLDVAVRAPRISRASVARPLR
jgi:hypothetical protein